MIDLEHNKNNLFSIQKYCLVAYIVLLSCFAPSYATRKDINDSKPIEKITSPNRCSPEEDKIFAHLNDENIEEIQRLIKKHKNINCYNKTGWTALNKAVLKDNKDIVKILLEAKANPNIESVAEAGGTTLTYLPMSSIKSIDVAKLLLAYGANINGISGFNPNDKDEPYFTALYEACLANNEKLAAFLLGVGADPNCPQKMGGIIVRHAIRHMSLEMVKLMVEKGANLLTEDGSSLLWTLIPPEGRINKAKYAPPSQDPQTFDYILSLESIRNNEEGLRDAIRVALEIGRKDVARKIAAAGNIRINDDKIIRESAASRQEAYLMLKKTVSADELKRYLDKSYHVYEYEEDIET